MSESFIFKDTLGSGLLKDGEKLIDNDSGVVLGDVFRNLQRCLPSLDQSHMYNFAAASRLYK